MLIKSIFIIVYICKFICTHEEILSIFIECNINKFILKIIKISTYIYILIGLKKIKNAIHTNGHDLLTTKKTIFIIFI